MMTPDLPPAQAHVLEEVTNDAIALLEYSGFAPEHARYALLMEVALDLAAMHGAEYSMECLEKLLREMRTVAEELK